MKTSRNYKHESIMEVCREAAYHFYIFNMDSQVIIERVDSEMKLSEIIDDIRDAICSDNIYKEASDSTIRKIIKDNYMIVQLYEMYDRAAADADRSWDGACFNGGC